MARVTQNRTDPDLCEILVKQSNATMHWMRRQGVRFLPQFGRQAFKVDGKFTFWGGATLAAVGGGRGLVDQLYRAAEKAGVADSLQRLGARSHPLRRGRDRRRRQARRCDAGHSRRRASILACGGFEANAAWRARHLGPGWDLAKVRGSKYNCGDGLDMALRIGAQPAGHWSGCHAVGWERYADDFGSFDTMDDYERDNYPFSIMVNARASASSTKAPISATTPMPSTAASSCSSRISLPGRSSIRRSRTCCGRNIARGASPR